jgi:hypothetical protein
MQEKQRHSVLRLAVAAVVIAALPALSQNVPGMDGRANDASNLVGSGGYNPTVAPSFFNTANLYVTGNVSRGAYFRGISPIRDATSLFLPLPSAVIGDFQRDAINLEAALNNPAPWQQTPYYNPYRTVPGAAAIQAGQNLPGSSLISTTYLVPQPYGAAPAGAAPLDVVTGTRSTSTVVPNSSIYTPYNTELLRGTDLYDRVRQTDAARALQQSPIFSRSEALTQSMYQPPQTVRHEPMDPYALDQSAGQRLAAEPIQRYSRTAPAEGLARDTSGALSPDLMAPAAFAPRLLGGPAGDNQERNMVGGWPKLPTDSRGDEAEADPITPYAAQPLLHDAIAPIPVGEQMLAARQQPSGLAMPMGGFAQPDEEAALAFETTGGVPEGLTELAEAVTFLEEFQADPQLREQMLATPTLREQYAQAMSVVRRRSAESIQSLAGEDTSRASALMRAAEEKVRAGDYYQASTLYGLAASLDEDNPLVRLGHAHALAAAGEYITAVLQLEQAIGAYRAFGFLRLDLTEFVRDPRDLDLRRADLEQRLERREDYRLRFLLGYLEYYSGFEKFGLPNLERAAQEAPEGSVIARFPEILKSPAKYLPDPAGLPALDNEQE